MIEALEQGQARQKRALPCSIITLGPGTEPLAANKSLAELYLELKQPEKAQQRLALLPDACGNRGEYAELREMMIGKFNPGRFAESKLPQKSSYRSMTKARFR